MGDYVELLIKKRKYGYGEIGMISSDTARMLSLAIKQLTE